MNQNTNKFNQESFVECDTLPGNVHLAFADDIDTRGVRGEVLHITSYTTGDTSGKPDGGLPEVVEGNLPKRISRKYIPLQSGDKTSQNAEFPQSDNEVEFAWQHPNSPRGTFVSTKDATVFNQDKGSVSPDVINLLKKLGHSDANQVRAHVQKNNAIKEKSIVVSSQSTNISDVKFDSYISENNSPVKSVYNVASETAINSNIVLTNTSTKAQSQNAKSKEPQTYTESISQKSPNNRGVRQENILKSNPDLNDLDTASKNNTQVSNTDIFHSDHEIYEKIRLILGEDKQDWKQVVKTAKNARTSNNPPNNIQSNKTLTETEANIEQVIQKVLNQEAINRVELEHVLTHKFSGELTIVQQSMNKKIQELRESFHNFMMR